MNFVVRELKIVFLGFPMFLTWELLQSPFYTDTFTDSWRRVLYDRIHCSVGDVMILLGGYWLVALVWGRSWIEDRQLLPVVVFVAIGASYTLFSEFRNVYVVQNWTYSEWMPRIGGIGLLPIFQWLIIPWTIVGAVRYRCSGMAETL